MLHHLLDSETDIIIADTTAGTDNVATSLNLAYDLNVFVVEPTKKSVSVYLDFIKLVPHLEDRVYVLANKTDGDEDIDFIKKHVPAERLIGAVPFSQHMKRFEQGDESAINGLHKEQAAVFDKVYELLRSKRRDWKRYLQLLNQAHEKVSVDWYNDYYQSNIGTDYDPEFSYEKVIATRSAKQPVGASA
jgi:CO dehydrogenase maturation factor